MVIFFSEIFGKYCWSARRIYSNRFLKGDLFSDIFGNFRKFSKIIRKYCWSARRIFLDRFLYGDYFFGNFRKLLENIVGVRDESFQTGSCMVIFFSEIFGKYCWSARRIYSNRFLKGDLFSDIFGNYRKFSEIIGKYCWSARQIFPDRFLYGDYFFGNFRKLLENIVGVLDESLQTGS